MENKLKKQFILKNSINYVKSSDKNLQEYTKCDIITCVKN